MCRIVADVVWPALLLTGRLTEWWCIGASILLEGAALWWLMRWRPIKAFAASALMNTVSACCGILLLPVAGLRWETMADFTINAWFGWGTFNLTSEAITCVIAIVINTVIETFILWLVFLAPWTRRLTLVVLGANAITVLMAYFWPWGRR